MKTRRIQGRIRGLCLSGASFTIQSSRYRQLQILTHDLFLISIGQRARVQNIQEPTLTKETKIQRYT